MTTFLAVLAEHEERAELFMPPWAFALIAAIIFALLFIISYSFRDVAHRHIDKMQPGDDIEHGHSGH